MPPHCDTMDGPVVKAAKRALESADVNLILPFVPKRVEDELRLAFQRTMRVRVLSPEAQETADRWFFETAVRLHREGEGAPFTGLKPAGLDPGPAVPRAERALDTGDPGEIIQFLVHTVEEQVRHRFDEVAALQTYDENDVDAAREYVGAMLGLVIYTHSVYSALVAAPHEQEHAHEPVQMGGHHH